MKTILTFLRLTAFLVFTLTGVARPVTISWDPSLPIEGVFSYNLIRITPGPPPSLIYTVVASTPDTSATIDAQSGWVFIVRAVNEAGESPDSNSVTVPALPLPHAPTNLRIASIKVEQSSDLQSWTELAQISIEDVPRRFFRIRF